VTPSRLERAEEIGVLLARHQADEATERLGLDGSDLADRGRRKDIHRAVSRWSLRGAIRGLGALFSELAGPPLAELRIYRSATTGPEEIRSWA
jgi:hypothetical protein